MGSGRHSNLGESGVSIPGHLPPSPGTQLTLPCSGATHFRALPSPPGLPAGVLVGRGSVPYTAGLGWGPEGSPFLPTRKLQNSWGWDSVS